MGEMMKNPESRGRLREISQALQEMPFNRVGGLFDDPVGDLIQEAENLIRAENPYNAGFLETLRKGFPFKKEDILAVIDGAAGIFDADFEVL